MFNPLEWVDPLGHSLVDATGRPLSSSNYSVWVKLDIPSKIHSDSRRVHFQNADQQLFEAIQRDPSLAKMLPSEIVDHVQPGARGAFAGTSPPNHSWHHNAQDPTKIELIPRAQHKAPGMVQHSLHPNQQGGFKKLSSKC